MFYRSAFWLMLPVAAVQGLWLRKKATRLPGAPGTRLGSTGAGPTLRLLAVGDSIIDGVGTSHIEESLPVQFAKALSLQMQRCVHWRVEGETGFDIDDVPAVRGGVDGVALKHGLDIISRGCFHECIERVFAGIEGGIGWDDAEPAESQVPAGGIGWVDHGPPGEVEKHPPLGVASVDRHRVAHDLTRRHIPWDDRRQFEFCCLSRCQGRRNHVYEGGNEQAQANPQSMRSARGG